MENFILYWPYALLGLIISLLLDVRSSGVKLQKFSLKKWLLDNFLRVILSIACVSAGLIFSKEVLGFEITPIGAFWGGLGNDAAVNFFIRRKANQNRNIDNDIKE